MPRRAPRAGCTSVSGRAAALACSASSKPCSAKAAVSAAVASATLVLVAATVRRASRCCSAWVTVCRWTASTDSRLSGPVVAGSDVWAAAGPSAHGHCCAWSRRMAASALWSSTSARSSSARVARIVSTSPWSLSPRSSRAARSASARWRDCSAASFLDARAPACARAVCADSSASRSSASGRSSPCSRARRLSAAVSAATSSRSSVSSAVRAEDQRSSASSMSSAVTGWVRTAGFGWAQEPQTAQGSPSARPSASSPAMLARRASRRSSRRWRWSCSRVRAAAMRSVRSRRATSPRSWAQRTASSRSAVSTRACSPSRRVAAAAADASSSLALRKASSARSLSSPSASTAACAAVALSRRPVLRRACSSIPRARRAAAASISSWLLSRSVQAAAPSAQRSSRPKRAKAVPVRRARVAAASCAASARASVRSSPLTAAARAACARVARASECSASAVSSSASLLVATRAFCCRSMMRSAAWERDAADSAAVAAASRSARVCTANPSRAPWSRWSSAGTWCGSIASQSAASSRSPDGASARASASLARPVVTADRRSDRSSAVRRRSPASQSSMPAKAEMSNSLSRTSRRASGEARRKAANSPWGSRTTLLNCSSPMPRTSVSTAATSSWRLSLPTQLPDTCSCRTTRAGALVMPCPRFFGRRNSGERSTRNRRPEAVNSSVTLGTTSGAAWSLRRERPLGRAPGTAAYRAKHTASRMLVLPAPVAPRIRKSPDEATSSKSMSTVPANGPKAVMDRRCSLMRPPLCGRLPARPLPRRRARLC